MAKKNLVALEAKIMAALNSNNVEVKEVSTLRLPLANKDGNGFVTVSSIMNWKEKTVSIDKAIKLLSRQLFRHPLFGIDKFYSGYAHERIMNLINKKEEKIMEKKDWTFENGTGMIELGKLAELNKKAIKKLHKINETCSKLSDSEKIKYIVHMYQTLTEEEVVEVNKRCEELYHGKYADELSDVNSRYEAMLEMVNKKVSQENNDLIDLIFLQSKNNILPVPTNKAMKAITKANKGIDFDSDGDRMPAPDFEEAASDAAYAMETEMEESLLYALPRLGCQALRTAKQFYGANTIVNGYQMGLDIRTKLLTGTGRILWFKNGGFETIDQ